MAGDGCPERVRKAWQCNFRDRTPARIARISEFRASDYGDEDRKEAESADCSTLTLVSRPLQKQRQGPRHSPSPATKRARGGQEPRRLPRSSRSLLRAGAESFLELGS